MGDVVFLRPRAKPADSARARLDGPIAQILFFTGVRYQRMIEPTPPQASGGRPSSEGGKRKRKRG